MNTKQEIIDAMNRENKGQAPPALFTQTGTVEQMNSCGACWPDAFYDIDKMIKLALQPSELFGFATVRIPYDLTSESERLGCTITEGSNDTQPAVISSKYASDEMTEPPEDLMPVDEFISGGRVAMHIEAAERISKEHPELFLTTNMLAPQGTAAYLVGMETYVMGSFMSPDLCVKWIEAMAPYQNELARRFSEVSDNVMLIVDASEDLISPDSLDTLMTPFTKDLVSNVKESFSLVHTCGQTDNVLEVLASLGATAVSVECFGDPQHIVDRIGDKTVLAGGVDPIGTLLQGTPEKIIDAAKKADAAGYGIIMPECGVPPVTPNCNLAALAKYREA